jgi:anaerobic magnesium-protoporphyrin IX monomethyl ester cyclase
MNKSVVLIYPRPTQGYLKERRRDIHVVKRIYAPLSIMYLASTLEEAGFSPFVFDRRLTTLDEIKEKVSEIRGILFFGISTMTGSQIKDGLEIAKALRSLYGEDIPLVWGGIHPTIFPYKTILHPLVDIIGYGEGDFTIVELAKAMAAGKPLSTVKGIYFMQDGNIIRTPPNNKIEPLDVLPIPAWMHLKDYLNPAQYPVLATITTSRGCPFSCTYCYKSEMDNAGHGHLWRSFSVDRIMREVDYLNANFGFDIFETADENFILNPNRAIELIRNFKSRKFKISAIRSNFLTYKNEVVKELPGFCDYVAYSPETGSTKIQALLNKKADYQNMKLLNARLRDMGIATIHTFIFGFPFETDDDIRATVELCRDFKKINPASRMAIYQYMPYPGAPLTDMMISKYSLVLPDNFEEWGKTDMYGELDLRFRPWVEKEKLKFLNDFQLLFNIVFNTHDRLGEEAYSIYESDTKIRELIGDISTIPRATSSPYMYKLNERLTPAVVERCQGRVFI